MRAKLPDHEGFVTRDGVKLAYEIYGDGADTMLFVPPWSIVHSRIYKAQLPYFSERFRCIAYDGRGNGKSDRPEDVAAYTLDNYLADALAVMDALEVKQAILGRAFVRRPARLHSRGISSRTRQGGHPRRYGLDHRTGALVKVCRFHLHGETRQLRRLGQIQSCLLAAKLS